MEDLRTDGHPWRSLLRPQEKAGISILPKLERSNCSVVGKWLTKDFQVTFFYVCVGSVEETAEPKS